MIKYSKINKQPLFLIERLGKKKIKKRYDLTSEDNCLQVCYLNLQKGLSIEPHLHIKNIKKTTISSEAWILIEGSIKATFYDVDKTKLYSTVLRKGDISILFNGGHAFKSLTKNTKIFEIKNGPYLGSYKEKRNF